MTATSERTLRRVLAQVRGVVRDRGLWRGDDRLLVACSGGLDSSVAAVLLDLLRPSLGHHLVLGHIDHGLRQDGAADLATVSALGAAREIPVVHARLALSPGANLQGRAREARYVALRELADSANCSHVVTAHHADDQAETVLMRLARGAGAEGLAGIRYLRADRVTRPLLGVTRVELLACACFLGVTWRDDPNNTNLTHSRNRVRLSVMGPLAAALPGAVAGLARSAENIAAWDDAARWWVDRALADQVESGQAPDHTRWLQVPRRAVPEQLAPLAALFSWAADRLEIPRLGHAAIAQIARTLRAPDGRGSTCKVRGMTVLIDRSLIRIEASYVARPEGADYPELAEAFDASESTREHAMNEEE